MMLLVQVDSFQKYIYLQVFAIQRHLCFIQWIVGKVSWNIARVNAAMMDSMSSQTEKLVPLLIH